MGPASTVVIGLLALVALVLARARMTELSRAFRAEVACSLARVDVVMPGYVPWLRGFSDGSRIASSVIPLITMAKSLNDRYRCASSRRDSLLLLIRRALLLG